MDLAPGHPVLDTFDLVAVTPLSEASLEHVVRSGAADMIALEVGSRLPFPIKKKHLDLCFEHGVGLEVTYASAVKDATCRRLFLSQVQALRKIARGALRDCLVLSSGAMRALEVRAPMEAGALWGLAGGGGSGDAAATALAVAPAMVLEHAARRRATGGRLVYPVTLPAPGHAKSNTRMRLLQGRESEAVLPVAAATAAGAGAPPSPVTPTRTGRAGDFREEMEAAVGRPLLGSRGVPLRTLGGGWSLPEPVELWGQLPRKDDKGPVPRPGGGIAEGETRKRHRRGRRKRRPKRTVEVQQHITEEAGQMDGKQGSKEGATPPVERMHDDEASSAEEEEGGGGGEGGGGDGGIQMVF